MKPKPDEMVARWIRPEVRGLSPYHVPDSTGFIKMDAMENPYRWPETLVQGWLERLRATPVNRYPDPSPSALKAQLRETMGIPADMNLLLGNGSDELIQLILLCMSGAQRVVLAPEPTFVMYRLIAAATGYDYAGVSLRADNFGLDGEAMLSAVEQHKPAVVFLAYPNNPTGNLFEQAWMHQILETAPGLVVVDEAYAPFAGDTFMQHLAAYPNLLIMRTLSKLGLAGLRLGVLVGPPHWLTELDKVRLPYNVNILTQVSAAYALQHYDVLTAQAQLIVRDRRQVLQDLEALEGVHPWPSRANFILFRVTSKKAATVAEGLRKAGILVKSFAGAGPPLEDCLRVTVGKPEENRAFLTVMKTLL